VVVANPPNMVARSELWRIHYRADRYLESASLKDVERRCRDIGDNLMNLTAVGALAPTPVLGPGPPWWEFYTHVLEELRLRRLGPYSIEQMDRETHERWFRETPPRGLRVLADDELPKKPYFAKVGRKEHLKPMFELGRVRIAPASIYHDPSLNSAIHDDELTVTATRSVRAIKARTIDARTGDTSSSIPFVGELRYSVRMKGNYYVYCLSDKYDFRLLDDFDSDALLVITKPEVFRRRLQEAVKGTRSDLQGLFGAVRYYDPYSFRPDQPFVPMLKHFKYAYQRELRFVWTSSARAPDWEPFFVELGSLADCAKFYELS